MLTKAGHMFHIDFGHFLGNIMKFGIYNRESAPFVLTPSFVHVMGDETGEDFQQFTEVCSCCSLSRKRARESKRRKKREAKKQKQKVKKKKSKKERKEGKRKRKFKRKSREKKKESKEKKRKENILFYLTIIVSK